GFIRLAAGNHARNSGKPELRCHPRLWRLRKESRGCPETSPGMTVERAAPSLVLHEPPQRHLGGISRIDVALVVGRDRFRRAELARTFAVLAPSLDELAVLGELDDTVVGRPAVAVRDIDVAVRRDRDVARPVERVLAVARHARLADRHQDLAVRAELDSDR